MNNNKSVGKKVKKVRKSKSQLQKEKIALFKKRVSTGVLSLNKKFGKSWIKKIDLSLLNLKDTDTCICGQLFDGFWNAQFGKFSASQFDNEYDFDEENGLFLIDNGFLLDSYDDLFVETDYDFLTNLWYIKIVELKIEAGLIP